MRNQSHGRKRSERDVVVMPDGREVGRVLFGIDESREPFISVITPAGLRLRLPLDKVAVRRNRFVLNMSERDLHHWQVEKTG